MTRKIAVVGGGIVGSSIAYFLAKYPEADVKLFEKAAIGSGTTAKSAATMCLIDDSVAHEFWSVRLFGFKFYTGLEKEEPGSTGFEQTGTLTVAPYPDYQMYVKQAVDLTVASGYRAEYWTDHDRIREVIPDLNLEGVLGAGWCPDDGFFDATMLSNTLVRRARSAGAQVQTGTRVTGITTKDGKVTGVDTDKGHHDVDVVVDATGPWVRHTASLVGIDLPIWHTKAEVFILVPAPHLGYPFPVVKYPRWYARKDKENVFICKAHMTMDLNDPTHAGRWDPDELPMTGGTDPYFWEFLTNELMNVYPRLLESSIGNDWVGYRAEPPDFLPLLGATPVDGYILAAGAGGNGVIEAPTIGRDIARLAMTGETSWYLDRLPLSRLTNVERVAQEVQAAKLQR